MGRKNRSYLIHQPTDDLRTTTDKTTEYILYYESSCPQQTGLHIRKVKDLENQIDVMVYKLYELTYEEVKIVDLKFWMREEEYENYTPPPMNRGVYIINNLTQVK